MLTNPACCDIIVKRSKNEHKRGGIAQLARATGSYPVGHGFKSNSRYHRPVGQAAKTPPFHGGNGSSILPRVTKTKSIRTCSDAFCFGILHEHQTPHKRQFADVCVFACKTTVLSRRANSVLSVAKQILPRCQT